MKSYRGARCGWAHLEVGPMNIRIRVLLVKIPLLARASFLRSNARKTLFGLKKNGKSVSHNVKVTGTITRIA